MDITDEWRQQPIQYKIIPSPPPSLLRYDTLFNEDSGSSTQNSFQDDWMDEDFSILCTPDNSNSSSISKEHTKKEEPKEEANLKPDSGRLAANSISALLSLCVVVGLVSYLCS